MRACFLLLCAAPLLSAAQIHVYNQGQAFTCISIDSNYNVWAGTSKMGLYLLDKRSNPAASQFTIVSSGSLSTANIQTIAADPFANVWVGHSGAGFSTAAGGGIERIDINNPATVRHYSPDRNAECISYFQRDGIATLNSASIAIDKNGTVWSAHRYHDLTSESTYILTPGSLSFKFPSNETFFSKSTYQDYRIGVDPPELPYPAYTCNPPISATPQARNCYAVACGRDGVWVSVAAYLAKNNTFYPSRLINYDLGGFYKQSYDFASIGIPVGGVFSGLWVTPKGDVWTTLSAGKGFAVRKKGNWVYLNQTNLSCIFSAGAGFNFNAIWGNKLGQVFLGTTKGLIVYNGSGPVANVDSYTLYTTQNNSLLSNNILGGVSEKDSIQWIATDQGIMASTLGRNYPSSVEEVDYTSCNNGIINDIEAQSNQDLSKQLDYHSYTVETEICSKDEPNGGKCNAQNIYKLIKANVSLTAPTPKDFPLDISLLNNVGLLKLSAAAIEATVVRISATTAPIVTAYSLFANAVDLFSSTKDVPFQNLLNSTADYERLQEAKNPKDVQPCASYYLYNSPIFIVARGKWNKYLGNIFCGGKLESTEYDRVWIFPDDRNLTFTNYTQPGHFLFPGKVVRTIVEDCGKVKIVTRGTGLNYCGDNILGMLNGYGNKIVGAILFKNIDFRLKEAFEKQQ
jgi:hypothetical protein